MKAQERLAVKAAMSGPPGVETLVESGGGKRRDSEGGKCGMLESVTVKKKLVINNKSWGMQCERVSEAG